jgi:hypothetical protein
MYYQNWHITLTKSRNKTASATAEAAASHHELCMMAMAIKPVTKNNKEQEPAFSLRALVTNATSNLFFYWRNFKNSKFENEEILEFCNRQK